MSNLSHLRREAWELEREKRKKQERLENVKKMAEQMVRLRQFRLREMQDRGRQIEKRLLFEGTDADLNADSLESDPWFISEDMSGKKNYIMQYMGAYMKRFWSKEA